MKQKLKEMRFFCLFFLLVNQDSRLYCTLLLLHARVKTVDDKTKWNCSCLVRTWQAAYVERLRKQLMSCS